jgi:2-polyprenyl-3-methyl-5-hydroxy-6-metoxy-1,4-benzoquinol methylase
VPGVFGVLRSWAATSSTVQRWRGQRYQLFLDACNVRPDDRIVDVGAGWGAALERFNKTNPIVALDLSPQPSEWLASDNVTVVQGDGTQMPFEDAEFDVAFSNSVIEHIPPELQSRFASEVSRVAGRYFVQTPNRYFPIEPHYQVPFFQFLPKRARQALNRRFTLGWQPKGQWEEISLLSAGDLRRLFPEAEIRRERVLGLTKSLIAVRR